MPRSNGISRVRSEKPEQDGPIATNALAPFAAEERQKDLMLLEGTKASIEPLARPAGTGAGRGPGAEEEEEDGAPRQLVPHAADADDEDESDGSDNSDDDSDDEVGGTSAASAAPPPGALLRLGS